MPQESFLLCHNSSWTFLAPYTHNTHHTTVHTASIILQECMLILWHTCRASTTSCMSHRIARQLLDTTLLATPASHPRQAFLAHLSHRLTYRNAAVLRLRRMLEHLISQLLYHLQESWLYSCYPLILSMPRQAIAQGWSCGTGASLKMRACQQGHVPGTVCCSTGSRQLYWQAVLSRLFGGLGAPGSCPSQRSHHLGKLCGRPLLPQLPLSTAQSPGLDISMGSVSCSQICWSSHTCGNITLDDLWSARCHAMHTGCQRALKTLSECCSA